MDPSSPPTLSATPTRATIAAPAPSAPTTAPPAAVPAPTEAVATGAVHDVRSAAEFDALCATAATQDALVVVDFMAKWCRKCKYLLPRFRKLAARHPGAYFVTVDVNAVDRLPRQFAIENMPTFVFLARGQQDLQVDRFVGGAAPQVVAEQLDARVEALAS